MLAPIAHSIMTTVKRLNAGGLRRNRRTVLHPSYYSRRILLFSSVFLSVFFVFLMQHHIQQEHYLQRQQELNNESPLSPTRLTWDRTLQEFRHNDSTRLIGENKVNSTSKGDTRVFPPNRNGELPPLEQVLDGYDESTEYYDLNDQRRIAKIHGLSREYLDFAVVGFGKCGTTSLLSYLSQHPNIKALKDEVYAMIQQRPERLVWRLYKHLREPIRSDETGQDIPTFRGYKCPGDIHQPYVLKYYRDYFPNTKLFVTLRHPVLWFQSLYNFRVQNFDDFEHMLHPNQLIGRCTAGSRRVCTSKGNFALPLLQLGKQYIPTEDSDIKTQEERRRFTKLEQDIIGTRHLNVSDIEITKNPVFIMEINQLGDTNKTRRQQLAKDLQGFVGVPSSTQFLASSTPREVPGKNQWNATTQAAKDAMKMQICQDQYVLLRKELMNLARTTSTWIREVFLDLPTVSAGSDVTRGHLESLLERWMDDPCGNLSDEVSAFEARMLWKETKSEFRERIVPEQKQAGSDS